MRKSRFALAALSAASPTASSAFVALRSCPQLNSPPLLMAGPSGGEGGSENERRRRRVEFPSGSGDGGDQAEQLGELSWRAAKVKLEDANTRSFLKRKPLKLKYEDARKWVQANLGPDNKEEFFDLVENGNLRTPYIPKQPEAYYSSTGEWISWDHFLRGIFDTGAGREPPSAVKPSSGAFD